MSSSSTETVLDLSTIPLPPGSARGIRERLEVVAPTATIRRTVNNQAISLRVPGEDKYRVSLSCDDLHLPSLDGLAVGDEVLVACTTELSTRISAGATSAALARTPVAGSVHARRIDGQSVSVSVNGRVVNISAQAVDVTVFYRPLLTCLVESWSGDSDEWAAEVGWSLELQEV
jgi:hypothetical protein